MPVGTYGPFSIRARCLDNGGNVNAVLTVTTSEQNSMFWSDLFSEEDDFDPNDPSNPYWIDITGNAPSGAQAALPTGNLMRADAPSGFSILGQASGGTNFAGAHCVFSGYVLTSGPQA